MNWNYKTAPSSSPPPKTPPPLPLYSLFIQSLNFDFFLMHYETKRLRGKSENLWDLNSIRYEHWIIHAKILNVTTSIHKIDMKDNICTTSEQSSNMSKSYPKMFRLIKSHKQSNIVPCSNHQPKNQSVAQLWMTALS